MGDVADLESISVWLQKHDSIHIHLSQLTDSENAVWEAGIQKAYRECGCTFGAYCLAATLACTALVIAVMAARGSLTYYVLRIGAIAVISSAILGKLTGIVSARLYAATLIRRLHIRCTAMRDLRESAEQ